MAGLMRSRVSPRGYLFVHPSEDLKIRMTERFNIGVTVATCTIGIKGRQAVRKMLLQNQMLPGHHVAGVGSNPSAQPLALSLAIISNNQ